MFLSGGGRDGDGFLSGGGLLVLEFFWQKCLFFSITMVTILQNF